MRVMRIFADTAGAARVEWREVPLAPDAGGRPTSPMFDAMQVFFRESPPGHVHGRHRAPRRQLIFVAGGVGEVVLDDGSRWRFGPGDVLFAENTTGHGHVTRTVEGTRAFVHVSVPASFDITAWPLAQRCDPGG